MKYFINVLFFIFIFNINAIKASETTILLTQEQVRQSILETLKVLNEVYVFPEKAKEIEAVMTDRMIKGAYDYIKTTEEFEKIISDELIEISTDGHLGIMLVKDEQSEPTQVLVEIKDEFKNNYAFQKLEVLSGNVGYIKFNKFHQDEAAVETVDHAFGFLKGTDAMIIDLRDCKGGSPELAKYILSYFFSEKTLLWQFHSRGNKNVYSNESIVGVGDSKFKDNYPLFILVGPDTASAAEMFSYTLKHYNKATVVGEKTYGIANAVGAFKINKYFDGRFTMSRTSNPVTKTNWELVGVLPDIKLSLDKSLEVAHTKALETLNKQ